MERPVKFAQQLLNRMVVFPSSPPTLFPLEFFRLAVTVRVVTPTETQLPCRQQHRSAFTDSGYFDIMLMCLLYFSIVYSINPINVISGVSSDLMSLTPLSYNM